jgi:ABC-2 type transport system ATP-binding protein
MTEIIKTDNLTKYYGKVCAVSNLSLDIQQGEIYGFLGLNGAGKTTTIRMLLGLINPSSGTASLFNEKIRPGNYQIWAKVGYLVEIPFSYPELTVRENLEIICHLRNLAKKDPVGTIISRMKLGEYSDRKAKDLSHGNSQRLGLAKALIHEPQLLLLDEPSNGLDPAGIAELREILHDLAFNRGVTILISSHILGEIAKIATRIGIIHEGCLVHEIEHEDLIRLLRKKLIIGTLNNKEAMAVLEANAYSATPDENGNIGIKDDHVIKHPEEAVKLLADSGFPPILVNTEQEDLESYFLRVIGLK